MQKVKAANNSFAAKHAYVSPQGPAMIQDSGPLQCCLETKRLVIVSPAPHRLQKLVAALSAECFDVMVFHRWQPELGTAIRADLLLVDASLPEAAEQGVAQPDRVPGLQTIPAIRIVDRMEDAHPLRLAGNVVETMVWPISAAEAVDKVRQVMQQSGANSPSSDLAEEKRYKDICVDVRRRTVHVSGGTVSLTKTEYEVLLALIDAEGAVITREELIQSIWGSDYFGGSNVVDAHLKSLRRKLGDSPAKSKYIITVRGVGYRLAD